MPLYGISPMKIAFLRNGNFLAGYPAGLALVRLRAGLVEHPYVVRGFEPALHDQGRDLGLLEHVFELVGAVRRVDVHHDCTDLGGRNWTTTHSA